MPDQTRSPCYTRPTKRDGRSEHLIGIYELATNLQDLWECLHNPRILVAVRLHGIYERDLRLGAWTEWLDDRREALRSVHAVNG